MQEAVVKRITWDQIRIIWEKFLWPGRNDILPISCMNFVGGTDVAIKENFCPAHHGIYINNILAGVVSGHKTSNYEYRCRGIYIHKNFRNNKYSAYLFESVEQDAIKNDCAIIWSYPRLSALNAYKKFGFNVAGDIENTGFSGPNIRVYKKLRKNI
jgi:GNAT superfamily N-acetyltransferase